MKDLIDAIEADLDLSGYRWKRLNDLTLVVGVELDPRGFEITSAAGLYTITLRKNGVAQQHTYVCQDTKGDLAHVNKTMDEHLNSLNVFG